MQTVQESSKFHSALDGPAVVQRQAPVVQTAQLSGGGRRCGHASTSSSSLLDGVPQVQFGCERRCEHAATSSGSARRR